MDKLCVGCISKHNLFIWRKIKHAPLSRKFRPSLRSVLIYQPFRYGIEKFGFIRLYNTPLLFYCHPFICVSFDMFSTYWAQNDRIMKFVLDPHFSTFLPAPAGYAFIIVGHYINNYLLPHLIYPRSKFSFRTVSLVACSSVICKKTVLCPLLLHR